MEGESSSQFTLEYMRILSELSNINQSEAQRENLINTLLLLISNQYRYIGSYIEVGQGITSLNLNKSFIYGINYEILAVIFRSSQQIHSQIIEDRFQMNEFIVQFEETEMMYSLQNFHNARITQLIYQSDLTVNIYMISDDQIEVNEELLNILQAVCRLLSNSYTAIEKIKEARDSSKLEREIFNENHLPIILLHRNYVVNRMNYSAQNLFEEENEEENENFFRKILPREDYELLDRDIHELPIGFTYEMNNKLLRLSNAKPSERRYNIRVKKLDVQHSFQILVLLEKVIRSNAEIIKSELDNPTKSLLNELHSYGKLYFSSHQEALDYGRKNFFPSAFTFTINEQSGPLVLASSPEMDYDLVFEECIKLVAGLNTAQINSQGYVSGSTPWATPEGEMRWIAFARRNLRARGEIEIHVIGMVVKENLLMIRSDLNNTIFGLLLGSMNNYMEVLDNDDADFVTTDFYFDEYFSTLSIIKNILMELRTGSAEVLAAMSTSNIK